MKTKLLLFITMLLFSVTVNSSAAVKLSVASLSRTEFITFMKEFVTIAGFKENRPAETFGIIGVEAGAGYEFFNTGKSSIWDDVYGQKTGSNENGIFVHIRKGLLFNLDAGVRYGNLVNTETNYQSFELRYGIMRGSMLTPAVALTANYTVITGFEDMKGNILGLNLSASKGLGPWTPYAGIGVQRIMCEPFRVTGLKEEKENVIVKYVGFRFSFTPVNYVNLQATVDKSVTFSASLNFGI